MKARVKATGEVHDIVKVLGFDVLLSNGNIYDYNKVEYITEPDWQQVRIQAAIAAMPIVADDGYNVRNEQHLIAKYSVQIADALVNELKKGGQDD